tara:strand:- start:106 stop:582 length:477 start_codon:yes stop_codon:yes gene_type:complete
MNKKPIQAVCVFQGDIKGYVLFKEDFKNKTVIVKVEIENIPKGKHGIHIHETGDLRMGCKSLCAHYNPHGKVHGGRDDKIRHVGDLGNVLANKNKKVSTTFSDKLIKLRGKYSIIGRSVVIHEDEDDLGKGGDKESLITGNAGKRIACGVIGYASTCK